MNRSVEEIQEYQEADVFLLDELKNLYLHQITLGVFLVSTSAVRPFYSFLE